MIKYKFTVFLCLIIFVSLTNSVGAQYGSGYYGLSEYSGTQDLVSPEISNVSSISSVNSAAISWNTNEPSTSQVEYGISESYSASSTLSSSLNTSHSVSINSLQSNTLYHYRVISKDASNNTSTSTDYTFTTPNNSSVINSSSSSSQRRLQSVRLTKLSTNSNPQLNEIINITRDLKKGDYGNDVKLLQNYLIFINLLDTNSNTGYFGNFTEQAMKKLESSLGIQKTTGIYDNQVRSLLMDQVLNSSEVAQKSSRFEKTLKLGDSGEDVRRLQIFLNNNGFSVSVSGAGSKGRETDYFGLASYNALKRFQDFYREEILTPYNLTNGTGFFGYSTMNKVNQLILEKN